MASRVRITGAEMINDPDEGMRPVHYLEHGSEAKVLDEEGPEYWILEGLNCRRFDSPDEPTTRRQIVPINNFEVIE